MDEVNAENVPQISVPSESINLVESLIESEPPNVPSESIDSVAPLIDSEPPTVPSVSVDSVASLIDSEPPTVPSASINLVASLIESEPPIVPSTSIDSVASLIDSEPPTVPSTTINLVASLIESEPPTVPSASIDSVASLIDSEPPIVPSKSIDSVASFINLEPPTVHSQYINSTTSLVDSEPPTVLSASIDSVASLNDLKAPVVPSASIDSVASLIDSGPPTVPSESIDSVASLINLEPSTVPSESINLVASLVYSEPPTVPSASIDSVARLIDLEPPTSFDFTKSGPIIHGRHLSEDLSALSINDLRLNNGEQNRNDQTERKGISSHSRHFSEDLSGLAINDLYVNKGEETGHYLGERKVVSRLNSAERNIYKAAEIAERFIQSIDKRVLVDTEAPIESVKEAVSKFGGILDWKERRKNVQNELDKALEDAPKYKERAEAAELEKNEVVMELCTTRRTIEGLKLNLEKTQTEAIQAQQDSELADIRFKEIQQGIACRESAATRAEIELARYRYASALSELHIVKDEIEQLQKEYPSLNTKRDNAETKACESSVASQEIEKTVDDLTLEIIRLKELLTSSQATHIIAEEHKLNVALAYQQEKENWQNKLRQADEEVQSMRDATSVNKDIESKLKAASTLLVKLKDEFSSYLRGECPEEVSVDGDAERPLLITKMKLTNARKELEDMRADIRKAKDDVRKLWNAAATFRADIEREEADLLALKHKEHLASLSISSHQEELSNMTYELNTVHERKKEAKMPMELQQATEAVEQAHAKAQMARYEVSKAREEADQVKSQFNVVKLRLEATSREILAVNASKEIATASANALQEYKDEAQIEPQDERISNNYMTLSLDEYDALSKKAQDAEGLAKKRVIKAVEKIKDAKDAEVRSLNNLEQSIKKINERKLELRAAQEKANSAQHGKLTMENELRKRRAKHEQHCKAAESAHAISGIPNLKSASMSFDAASSASNPQMVGTLSRADTMGATRVKEPKPKKSIFPRSIAAMFVSRKKTH